MIFMQKEFGLNERLRLAFYYAIALNAEDPEEMTFDHLADIMVSEIFHCNSAPPVFSDDDPPSLVLLHRSILHAYIDELIVGYFWGKLKAIYGLTKDASLIVKDALEILHVPDVFCQIYQRVIARYTEASTTFHDIAWMILFALSGGQNEAVS